MAKTIVSKAVATKRRGTKSRMSDEDAEQILADAMKLPAELSCEEMDELERWWELERPNRRCALIYLTRPFKWVRKKTESSREFAVTLASIGELLNEQLANYKRLVEMLERAQARMILALACRRDMEAVLEDGKKSILRGDDASVADSSR